MFKSILSVFASNIGLAGLIVGMLSLFYCIKFLKFFLGWRSQMKEISSALEAFPGPEKHWLFGNILQMPGFNDEGIRWFHEWTVKYPKALTIWIGPFRPMLITYHPDTCKQVLRSTEPKQVSGLGGYNLLRPWLGDGLLLSSGEKWFRNRRLLTPGFHFDVLKPYMNIYNTATNIFLDSINNKLAHDRSVEVFQCVSLCTLDVILKCAFSSDMDVQSEGSDQQYVNAVIKLAKLIMQRGLNPLVYPTLIYNLTSSGREFNRLRALTHKVSDDVIQKRKQTLNTNKDQQKKRYPDFLDILLLAKDDDGKGLTDSEIRDEVDTFLFEGHDTTASAISWALYALADNHDHQEKCFKEISKVLSDRQTDDITWDDLNSFPHLAICIKEAMRLHTPVPIIGREVKTELTLEGIKIPRGTNVEVNIFALHHNEAVWGEDYNAFRPDRFDGSMDDEKDSFSFVPFSAGPRNCIGQNFAMHEIKVILAKTLFRYRLSVNPAHPAGHVPELVTRAENGLHIFFDKRETAKI